MLTLGHLTVDVAGEACCRQLLLQLHCLAVSAVAVVT
jgi:hypothetical protein